MSHPTDARPLKVVYCASRFQNYTGGQQSLAELVAHLPADVEPLVVFPADGPAPEAMRGRGLPVRIVAAPARLGRFDKELFAGGPATKAADVAAFARYSLRLWRFLRSSGAQVVHCNETRALLLFGPAAFLAGKPVVWHIRSRTLLEDHPPLRWSAHRLADRVVTVCDALQAEVDPGTPVRTIYNGVSERLPDAPGPAPAELAAALEARDLHGDGTFVVLTASSLVPYKGLHHLLDALVLMVGKRPELRRRLVWLLLGAANSAEKQRYLDRLRGQAATAGLGDNLLALGWRDDAREWMRCSDVVVVPSVAEDRLPSGEAEVTVVGTEGLPRVILDAFSVGRPVVGSSVAGIAEALTDGREGLVVAPGDAPALAEALLALLDAPERRAAMAAAAERRAGDFSIERTVASTVAVYAELAG